MFIFSASENMFYSKLDKPSCERAGTWPEDAVDVDDDVFLMFSATPPIGKSRGVVNGLPAWVDIPPPTASELIAAASREKVSLRATADYETEWRQDAVDTGIATAGETAALAEWKRYRVLLMRVDTSKAPDIDWPTPPEGAANQ